MTICTYSEYYYKFMPEYQLHLICRYIVEESRRMGLEVIDRCNLTVLLEPDQENLVDFLAEHKV